MASEKHQKMIDSIMDNFNFCNVLAGMEALDWRWSTGGEEPRTPGEPEVRQKARRLLKDAITQGRGKGGEQCVSCGGLVALFRDGPNGYLRLAFELEDYEANANEIE
jgi:hypothetical protein